MFLLGRTGRLANRKELAMSDTTAVQIPAIEIPERVTEQVEMTIAVEAVQKGDVLENQKGALRTVATKKTGPKWTVLENPDAERIVRLENGTQVTVRRTQETEASQAARYAAMQAERIIDAVNSWTPSVPEAMEKLNEHVAKGYVVGYQEMDRLAEAQADDLVWARYCQAVRYQMLEADEPVDAVTARDRYIDDLTKQIVSKAQYVSNRSSSQMSNLLDDKNLAAMGRFVERRAWGW